MTATLTAPAAAPAEAPARPDWHLGRRLITLLTGACWLCNNTGHCELPAHGDAHDYPCPSCHPWPDGFGGYRHHGAIVLAAYAPGETPGPVRIPPWIRPGTTPTSTNATQRHPVTVTRPGRLTVTARLVCIGGRKHCGDRSLATVQLPSGAHITVHLDHLSLTPTENS